MTSFEIVKPSERNELFFMIREHCLAFEENNISKKQINTLNELQNRAYSLLSTGTDFSQNCDYNIKDKWINLDSREYYDVIYTIRNKYEKQSSKLTLLNINISL